jgi:hypothetical protein
MHEEPSMNRRIATQQRTSSTAYAVRHVVGLALIGATALVLSNSFVSAPQPSFAPLDEPATESAFERESEAVILWGRPN